MAGTSVCTADPVVTSDATTPQAAGMVDVQTLIPDVELEMRYARTHNFVATPIAGYEAPRCYLHRAVAEALRSAAATLREQQLRLKIFDCYRPVRAVQHFVRWAHDLTDQRTKAQFYPKLDKGQLLDGYIASTSGHSRGATLDLTLARCATATDCRELDMGTPFDFFDERANTDHVEIAPPQRENRHRLRAAMEAAGFRNYPMEWWHYTFEPEPTPSIQYDFVVR